MPAAYTAAYLDRANAERLRGAATKDVRETLKVGEVPMPELAPDEVLVAVMAGRSTTTRSGRRASSRSRPSSSSTRWPQGGWNERHGGDRHVIGSDAAGVVVRTGAAVRKWSVGDR